MPLTRVTISGADDGVDVDELVSLTREYPFVEWGILRSRKRGGEDALHGAKPGEPRYPSIRWRNRLSTAFDRKGRHLAAHLCGELARHTMAGDQRALHWSALKYDRFQLNGASSFRLPALLVASQHPEVEFILQCGAAESLDDLVHFIREEGYKNVSILFDQSGGRGIAPPEGFWPWPIPGIHMGYAGGLNPENIVGHLEALAKFEEQPFWVDMESGVRTDDQFDLEKVRLVLERAKPFVWQNPAG